MKKLPPSIFFIFMLFFPQHILAMQCVKIIENYFCITPPEETLEKIYYLKLDKNTDESQWITIDPKKKEPYKKSATIYYELYKNSGLNSRSKKIIALTSLTEIEQLGNIIFDIKKPFINCLYVEKKFRNQGIATALISLARINLSQEYPNASVRITATPLERGISMNRLIKFYEKNGAKLISQQNLIATMEFPPLPLKK